QLDLDHWGNLRLDDDEAGMQWLSCVEPAKIASVVCDKDKVPIHDARHEIPVGVATQAEPIYVVGLMAALPGEECHGAMQAFIDQNPQVSPPLLRNEDSGGTSLSGTNTVDFGLRPISLSVFGRPRDGCAITQILDSSSRRGVRLG